MTPRLAAASCTLLAALVSTGCWGSDSKRAELTVHGRGGKALEDVKVTVVSGATTPTLDRASRAASPVYSVESPRRLAGPVELRFRLDPAPSSGDRGRLIAATRSGSGRPWALRLGQVRGGMYAVATTRLSQWQLRVAKAPPAPPIRRVSLSGTVVALGDSFSSGEGVPPFDPDTDNRGKNTCHRSERAWPVLLARQLNAAPARFFACSGATTQDVLRGDDQSKEPERRTAQLARLAETGGVRLVTLTIGGNDIGFADILKYCIGHISCQKHYARTGEIDDKIAALRTRLADVYQQIRLAAPGAAVLVMDYPRLFRRSPAAFSCAGPLNSIGEKEQRYLNEETAKADRTIAAAAFAAGVRFVGVRDAFEGHELSCSRDRYVNLLTFFRHGVVSHYSYHPNAAGHARLAELAIDAMTADSQPARTGVGGDCGAYTTGRIPSYGPPGGDRRSRDVVLRVVGGSVLCTDARSALDWYVHAPNPCENAGNTCPLDHDGWTCLARTAGSYPIVFACSSAGIDVEAWDEPAARLEATERRCGNASPDVPGPFDVRANIRCAGALLVAREYAGAVDRCGERCAVDGFTCRTRQTGYESASTKCSWAGRFVRFVSGS